MGRGGRGARVIRVHSVFSSNPHFKGCHLKFLREERDCNASILLAGPERIRGHCKDGCIVGLVSNHWDN